MPEEEAIIEEEVVSGDPPKEPAKREAISMDDLDGKNRFLDLKMGTTIELITKKVEKVQDDNYCLSNSQNADGKTYKIEITDQDEQVLSITSWKLWNLVRVAFKALNSLAPIQLRISHPSHGAYEVEYMKDGGWIKAEI